MRTRKYSEGGDVERTKDYDKIKSYSLEDIKGFFGGQRDAPKEVRRETEDEREMRRETRGAVPGMGSETPTTETRAEPAGRPRLNRPPVRRRAPPPPPPAPRSERAPTVQGGGMSEEDIVGASRATAAPFTRIPRGRESNLMRTLRRAIHGEERAREMEARGYAKGGHVKKMASGGTCRGMGMATRGGDYKVR